MTLRAVYPGSFDPPTSGHLDLATRASALFDEVVLCILTNPAKTSRHPMNERLIQLRAMTRSLTNVTVDASTDELLVDYCRRSDITVIVRGLRSGTDLGHELPPSLGNRQLTGIETVYLPTTPTESHVSSTAISAAIT